MPAHPETRVPPGPPGVVPLAEIRRAPIAFLERIARTHGDVTRHATEDGQVITVNRADLARRVLRDRSFRKSDTPDDAMLTPLLGRGLLTSEGETWKRQRRVTQPAFERDRVSRLSDVVVDETQALLARWAKATGPVQLDHDLSGLTLAVVARAILGSDVSGIGNRFGAAVDTVNRFMGHYDPLLPGGEAAQARADYANALAFLDGLVAILVAGRRALGRPTGEPDLLDRLLDEGFDARQIRDQVLTMLMAGHETTAKALGWSLVLLDRHPDVAARLDAELAPLGGRPPGPADLARLPGVRHVVQEAMRLYPPVWLISRMATVATDLDGYRVDPGTLVCVSPYLLHRHPDYWDEPERFVPERFAAAEPTWPDGAYMPFSDGPRRCIGERLALLEAQIVLAMLRQRVDLRLDPEHPIVVEALVTLRPRDGLRASVTVHG